jgi:ADP-ribose pyrophosphatase YjhB (NUDIX family)
VFLRLFVDHVRSADGHVGTREYLRHPGAVMVVPLLDHDHVLLERQFRYPLGRAIVEFPAGKIDAGESPFECGKRELLEETGYTAGRWSYLGGLHNAIAYSDEKIESSWPRTWSAPAIRRSTPGDAGSLRGSVAPVARMGARRQRHGRQDDGRRVLAGEDAGREWTRRPPTDAGP